MWLMDLSRCFDVPAHYVILVWLSGFNFCVVLRRNPLGLTKIKQKEFIKYTGTECSDVLAECEYLAGVSRNVFGLLKCLKASLEVAWDPRVSWPR